MTDPHEVLGVPPDADEATVRSAFRDLAKRHHPDHGGSRERFAELADAYRAMREGRRDGPSSAPRTVCREEVRVARPAEHRGRTDLLARGDGLELRLTVLTDRLPCEALLPDHVESGRRFAVGLVVTCCADDPIEWRGRRLRVVDGDGERHVPSVYRPDAADLPGPWRGDDVELAPCETVHACLLSRPMPADVEPVGLTYDCVAAPGGRRHLRFDLDADRRRLLDRSLAAGVRGERAGADPRQQPVG